jgi:hypothetical protein
LFRAHVLRRRIAEARFERSLRQRDIGILIEWLAILGRRGRVVFDPELFDVLAVDGPRFMRGRTMVGRWSENGVRLSRFQFGDLFVARAARCCKRARISRVIMKGTPSGGVAGVASWSPRSSSIVRCVS